MDVSVGKQKWSFSLTEGGANATVNKLEGRGIEIGGTGGIDPR